jgi:hypothetical protein
MAKIKIVAFRCFEFDFDLPHHRDYYRVIVEESLCYVLYQVNRANVSSEGPEIKNKYFKYSFHSYQDFYRRMIPFFNNYVWLREPYMVEHLTFRIIVNLDFCDDTVVRIKPHLKSCLCGR